MTQTHVKDLTWLCFQGIFWMSFWFYICVLACMVVLNSVPPMQYYLTLDCTSRSVWLDSMPLCPFKASSRRIWKLKVSPVVLPCSSSSLSPPTIVTKELEKRAHLGKVSPPLISMLGENLQNTWQAFPQQQIQEYRTAGRL